MTVSYQYDVASSTSGGFTRLLFKWRGSVYKLVYRELLLFGIFYTALSIIYRFILSEAQKRLFELAVAYCATIVNFIPLSFVLGFYVTFVAARWWNQFLAIPWPDRLMHAVALHIGASDDTSRMMRRTLMRYANLTLVLVLRSISMAVKKRFPTKEHLIEAGYMTKSEVDMIRCVPSVAEYNTYWIPCTWFVNLLREAKRGHQVTDNQGVKLIMEELNEFRAKCGMLWSYDWVSIPLVYTQVCMDGPYKLVVTLATYSFFAVSVIGRQFVRGSMEGTPTNNLPLDSVVAEQLINPFGDDDEDFELNWIIDRHITVCKVSYLGVDLLNGHPPPLIKDQYFHDADIQLPYTEAAVAYKRKTYRGSVYTMQVPQEQQQLVLPDITEEEDEDVIAENYHMGARRPSVWTIIGGKINAKFSSTSSVCQGEDSNTQNDNGDQNSDYGSRRVSFNSLFVDHRNYRNASTEGIRGNSGLLPAVSYETIAADQQALDDDMSLSSVSAPSLEEYKAQHNSGNAVSFRGSDETEYMQPYYKSVQTLNPSSSFSSSILPARSFSRLKINKKTTKDLLKKMKVTRHLSWGRKPASRPWISIAGRNECPFKPFKRRTNKSESSDDEERLTIIEKDGKEDHKLVSISVECPSNPNIFDEDDGEISSKIQKNEQPEDPKGRSSIDKPKYSSIEESPPKVVRDGTSMVKQQSLDEANANVVNPKIQSVYQSLPVLELQQPKQNSPDKSVKWRSDTIQQRSAHGNGFKMSKSASSDNNPALLKSSLKSSRSENSSNSMDTQERPLWNKSRPHVSIFQ
ncbi:Bestrophin-2 [Nymphon striatum]|nr:Bestrophin-2 [Nymphon striatum]